jgi:TonB family protein
MNPGGDDRGHFRRNVLIIAVVHIIVLGGLWFYSYWKNHNQPANDIAWLDGGGAPAAADSGSSPTPEDTPAEDETPTPSPTPEQDQQMASPTPDDHSAPSQMVIATPTPAATPVSTPEMTPTPEPTDTPEPTPKPTPRETPKPKPKASPKPKPKHKPKPKTSPSPHKHPSPHKSPTPDDDPTADTGDDAPTKSAKAAFKKATGHALTGGTDGDIGTAPGTGGGHRGGNGHAGGGNTQGDFGWYHSMLHDTFYGRWIEPTSIATNSSSYSALVKIRIEKDGTISDVSLAKSSGNEVMDQSVMDAARKVTQVDPLPDGLGDGGAYEVTINFEDSKQSQ